MPVNPDDIDLIAARQVLVYKEAELQILGIVRDHLDRGIDAPTWAQDRLTALGSLRRATLRVLAKLRADRGGQFRAAVSEAYRNGRGTVLTDLPGVTGAAARAAVSEVPRLDAIEALSAALIRDVGRREHNVLRHVEDVYRQVQAAAVARSIAGGITRREASQAAWQGLVDQGVTSFTDIRGRTWRLTTYVEMAVRTVTARAAVQGQLDRLDELGIPLVIVSNESQECPRCRPFEGKILAHTGPFGLVEMESVTTGETVTVDVLTTLDMARLAGLMHPNCFPGSVLVSAPSGVDAADARWYEGDLVVIHTAGGDELPVTPNHPVLTPEGWVAAGALKVGDSVLRYLGGDERVVDVGPGDEQVPTSIREVFNALRESSPVPAVRMPATAEQFHGDGFDADVQVVLADRLLASAVHAQLGEGLDDGQFVWAGSALGALLTDGAARKVVLCADHAARGLVGSLDLGGSLLGGHALPLPAFGRATVGAVAASQKGATHEGLRVAESSADLRLGNALQVELDGVVDPAGVALFGDSGGSQLAVEGAAADADGGRDLARRLAGEVSADHVVKIERRNFAGHVYNLQSGDGWYVAQGIVVHNCRHTIRPYLPGATRQPAGPTEQPEEHKARVRQREIERKIRGSKEQVEAALTPEATTKAQAKVRLWQAEMRQHLKDNPSLKRLPYREEIGAGNLPPGGTAPSPAGHLHGPPQPKPTPAAAPAKPVKKTAKAAKKAVQKTAPPPPSKAAKAAVPAPSRPAKKPASKAVRKTTPPPPSKAKKAAVTPTRTYAPPAVQAAQVHVRSIVDIPAADLPETLRVLDAQAALTPLTAQHLKAVLAPHQGTEKWRYFQTGRTSNAYYTFGVDQVDPNLREIVLNPMWVATGLNAHRRQELIDLKLFAHKTGWSAPTGLPPGHGATLAHEYGHHVSRMFLDAAGNISEPWASRFLTLLNDQLGTNRFDSFGRNGDLLEPVAWGFAGAMQTSVHAHLLERWVNINKLLLTVKVSEYGSSNFLELLAEIWQEYSTMGPAARPHIIKIGEVMREMAEEAARTWTP